MGQARSGAGFWFIPEAFGYSIEIEQAMLQ